MAHGGVQGQALQQILSCRKERRGPYLVYSGKSHCCASRPRNCIFVITRYCIFILSIRSLPPASCTRAAGWGSLVWVLALGRAARVFPPGGPRPIFPPDFPPRFFRRDLFWSGFFGPGFFGPDIRHRRLPSCDRTRVGQLDGVGPNKYSVSA